MNEITLDALINLFAIFSSVSGSTREHARKVFSNYIELHLGISESREYLELFDELIDLLGVGEDKPLPFDAVVQVETICGTGGQSADGATWRK